MRRTCAAMKHRDGVEDLAGRPATGRVCGTDQIASSSRSSRSRPPKSPPTRSASLRSEDASRPRRQLTACAQLAGLGGGIHRRPLHAPVTRLQLDRGPNRSGRVGSTRCWRTVAASRPAPERAATRRGGRWNGQGSRGTGCGCVRGCGTTTFITLTRRLPAGRSARNVRPRSGSSTASAPGDPFDLLDGQPEVGVAEDGVAPLFGLGVLARREREAQDPGRVEVGRHDGGSSRCPGRR